MNDNSAEDSTLVSQTTSFVGYLIRWLDNYSFSMLNDSERGYTFALLIESLSRMFRLVLRQPSRLQSALSSELATRGYTEDHREGVISSATLRIVDHSFFRATGSKIGVRVQEQVPTDVVDVISTIEGIKNEEQQRLLKEGVNRVLESYQIVDALAQRTETQYSPQEDDERLERLWRRLKPEVPLGGLINKQWRDLGFQGTSPVSDFRGLGILALDSFLYFAQEHNERAIKLVDEAVNGGEKWYPAALASIHMTAFVYELAMGRELQLFLLRSLQTKGPLQLDPDEEPAKEDIRTSAAYQSVLGLSAELLLAFHEYWMLNDYNVMQFEQVSKSFQSKVKPSILKGSVDFTELKAPTNKKD